MFHAELDIIWKICKISNNGIIEKMTTRRCHQIQIIIIIIGRSANAIQPGAMMHHPWACHEPWSTTSLYWTSTWCTQQHSFTFCCNHRYVWLQSPWKRSLLFLLCWAYLISQCFSVELLLAFALASLVALPMQKSIVMTERKRKHPHRCVCFFTESGNIRHNPFVIALDNRHPVPTAPSNGKQIV